MTIAVGGFQHETNTFAPHLAPFEAFARPDSWPALTRGDDLFGVMKGLNIPLSGFIERARAAGHRLQPLSWCSAEPSSYVTTEAFDRITDMLCSRLSGLRGPSAPDAVYLDLHGAMVTEAHQDGEGECLRRIREAVGTDVPLIVSLDLHANITAAMVEHCDGMTVYRTYPHLDMAATGARALDLLVERRTARDWFKTMRKIPFLIPLTAQCTDFEPCRSVYAALGPIGAAPGVANIDFAAGFPASDIAECGAAVAAFGRDPEAVEDAAHRLFAFVLDNEPGFGSELLGADDAVTQAMAVGPGRTVVIADAQDNPGAGATSDTTGLLDALLRHGARGAVLAILHDPDVAARAHQAGIGAQFDARLGARSGFAGVEPLPAGVTVEALGDGDFTFTGEMNRNARASLGPMALLRIHHGRADVRVIVGSVRAQCHDLAIFRHLGVEPAGQRILVVKSTVHFRADFDPIAARTLVAIAPGANACRLPELDYRRLRAGVRLEPMGPAHRPEGREGPGSG